MFLTQAGNNGSINVVGSLYDNNGRGWSFISYIQRGNSRKLRDTAEQAAPKWFKGYMVDARTAKEAIDLTVAYRDGQQWATDAALDGFIKTIS